MDTGVAYHAMDNDGAIATDEDADEEEAWFTSAFGPRAGPWCAQVLKLLDKALMIFVAVSWTSIAGVAVEGVKEDTTHSASAIAWEGREGEREREREERER